MPTLTKEMIDFAADAYKQLKKEENVNHKILLNTDSGRIKYLMEKENWYYGKWVLFEGERYFCSFSEDLLKDLIKE